MNTYYELQEEYFGHFNDRNTKKCVVVMTVNGQSCTNLRTFDELKFFVSKCKSNIDVIVASETWIKFNETDIYYIDGYSAFHSCRRNRRGGGLSIFIKQEYAVTEVEITELLRRKLTLLASKFTT